MNTVYVKYYNKKHFIEVLPAIYLSKPEGTNNYVKSMEFSTVKKAKDYIKSMNFRDIDINIIN